MPGPGILPLRFQILLLRLSSSPEGKNATTLAMANAQRIASYRIAVNLWFAVVGGERCEGNAVRPVTNFESWERRRHWRGLEGVDPPTQRVVAVRCCRRTLPADPVFAKRLSRDAYAAAGLIRSAVVPFTTSGEKKISGPITWTCVCRRSGSRQRLDPRTAGSRRASNHRADRNPRSRCASGRLVHLTSALTNILSAKKFRVPNRLRVVPRNRETD